MYLKCYFCQATPYLKCKKCKLFLCEGHLSKNKEKSKSYGYGASKMFGVLCNPCRVDFNKAADERLYNGFKNKPSCLVCLMRPATTLYCCAMRVCQECYHRSADCPVLQKFFRKFVGG